MKQQTAILLLLISLFVSLQSCKKNRVISKSKTELITSKSWIYNEYYREYNTGTPVLYYKRGNTNNLINLNLNKVTFRSDGTYTEVNESGATLSGTWTFLNNETQVQVTNTQGIYTSTINLLDDVNYNWYAPTASNGTLGKMIHE